MENVDRKRKLVELGPQPPSGWGGWGGHMKSSNPGTYLQLRTVCCERAEARRDNFFLLKK